MEVSLDQKHIKKGLRFIKRKLEKGFSKLIQELHPSYKNLEFKFVEPIKKKRVKKPKRTALRT